MTKGPGLPRMEGFPGHIGHLLRSHLSLHRVANADIYVSAALLNVPNMLGTLFPLCSALPSLPPSLLPNTSASFSHLSHPSTHVSFSKKPSLASPRKEFPPEPLNSAEFKGAGSAVRRPGVASRLLHTPRHDSGASAFPCAQWAHWQLLKVLGRMK